MPDAIRKIGVAIRVFMEGLASARRFAGDLTTFNAAGKISKELQA
jgi:hypothetical protein